MKTLLSFMAIAMLSFLSVGTADADGGSSSCPGLGFHLSCKGLLATVYVDTNAGPVATVKFSAPSSETVIGVTGPYANPGWGLVNGEIVVNLRVNNLDPDGGWMEVAVRSGGYYHVRLIYQ